MSTVLFAMFKAAFQWISYSMANAIYWLVTMLNSLSIELFKTSYIQGFLDLFQWFGITLCISGIVVAISEIAIESKNGDKINGTETFINCLKGIFAALLFTEVPILLFDSVIIIQNLIMTATNQEAVADTVVYIFDNIYEDDFVEGFLTIGEGTAALIYSIFLQIADLILFLYAAVKIFFSAVKRAGILFITICTGSLYMFSIPRGYIDGFIGWCKQVIAICFTHFLQIMMFYGAFIIIGNSGVSMETLGAVFCAWGLILAATEVPRIAQQFGIETSARIPHLHLTQKFNSVVNATKSISSSASKINTVNAASSSAGKATAVKSAVSAIQKIPIK